MGRTAAVVLFTDLVGSTELRGRLGEEAADELRRKHDQLLARAVEANNGRVVKGLGDGIMATFTGAADGVAAAVAIQQGIDRLNRSGKAAVPLAVRVGLSAGDVAFEDDDVHGTPVTEASRLCGAAAGSEIIVSEVVRLLAGVSASWVLAQRGPIALKGLPDPVAAWEVRWEPAPVSMIPMPALLTDVGRIFVGRDAELERLQQLWKEAAAGERRVALLAGEPGVGKTRLAAELAVRVHEEGGVVLAGRCDEDLGVPYQPFVEALRHFVDHKRPDGLCEELGRYGGELARLVPDLSELPGLPPPLKSDPETERYRLFEAVAVWLAAVSADEPLLVVLDDLQWAAKPTLLLLRHVVRSPGTSRLLIVGTYRDTELGRDHPLVALLADLRRDRRVDRLALTGLKRSDVVAFMAEATGHQQEGPDLVLAHAVHNETGGNPFFVREVLRHLHETGIQHPADEDGGGPVTKIPTPESVRDVITRRAARLPHDVTSVLRTAAVVGADFETRVVQAASRFDEDALLTALEHAASARLIISMSGDRFRFAHALVRETFYDQMSEARRVTLHRRVGVAIETVHTAGLDDQLGALAHHFARAGADNRSKAVDYAVRAGDLAMAQLAFETAAAHYERALVLLGEEAEEDPRRGSVMLALGKARARAGDRRSEDAYITAAKVARGSGHAEVLAGAALGLADLWGQTGTVDDTRMALLDDARVALGETTSPTTVQLLGRIATELYFVPGTWERRQTLSARAVDIARHLGDPLILAAALHARNYAMWGPGGTDERLAVGREIVRLAHEGGDPELALHGHAWCQTALLELGDVVHLDVELAAYRALADELRQPRYHWYAATRRAMRVLLTGDLDEGERLARAARQLGVDAGEADVENIFGAQMFIVWQERPTQQAIDHGEVRCQMAEKAAGTDSFIASCLRLMRLVLLLDVPGRRQQARAEIEAMLPVAVERLDPSFYGMGWSIFAVLLSTAAARLSALDAAARMYERLVPHAGGNAQDCGAVTFLGSYSHHLGLLATTLTNWGDAEAHLAAAAAVHERMGAGAYLARTRLEWARMLLTRRQPGDAERTRDLLGQALATARELGLAKVERDAVALLT